MSGCRVPGVEILRKKYGLTQEDLSLMSGIDKSSISRIETGLQNPTFVTLEALAVALECSVFDLANPPQPSKEELLIRQRLEVAKLMASTHI